jgi:hypothetical protein
MTSSWTSPKAYKGVSSRIAGRGLFATEQISSGEIVAVYLAAQSAARTDPASRAYYECKRAEGKHHRQAILALARRRLNVLWAMLRDHTPYETSTATAA